MQCRQYWFPGQYAHLCEDEDLSKLVHQAMAVTYDVSLISSVCKILIIQHIIGILLKMSDSLDESCCESLKDLGSALEETMETAFSNYSLEFKIEKLVLVRNASHLMRKLSFLSRSREFELMARTSLRDESSCFRTQVHLEQQYRIKDGIHLARPRFPGYRGSMCLLVSLRYRHRAEGIEGLWSLVGCYCGRDD